MKQTITLELEVPGGYELTGEYRVPTKDEYFLNSFGGVCKSVNADDEDFLEDEEDDTVRFILRPVKRIPKLGEVWSTAGRVYLLAHWNDAFFNVASLDGSRSFIERKEVIMNCYEFIREHV